MFYFYFYLQNAFKIVIRRKKELVHLRARKEFLFPNTNAFLETSVGMGHLFCGMSPGISIGWAGSETKANPIALNDKIRSPSFSRQPENEREESR